MTKENGHLQHRRGIWEHVRTGRLTLQDIAVHQYIASQADTRTGVWNGSAGALSGELCISARMARRFLERLSGGDYVRRFPIPGKHICYPILVHKYRPTTGEHRGEQLDAINSISPMELRYVPIENGEHEGEQRGEHVSSQKRSKNREERKDQNPAAKPAPPADPRFQPFKDFAFNTYQEKHQTKPSWLGKDFQNLKLLLKANPSLDGPELERRWRAYLASSEPFTSKQADSLAYFATRCDQFSNGPILIPMRGNYGSYKGNESADDRLRQSLRNLGFNPSAKPS